MRANKLPLTLAVMVLPAKVMLPSGRFVAGPANRLTWPVLSALTVTTELRCRRRDPRPRRRAQLRYCRSGRFREEEQVGAGEDDARGGLIPAAPENL